MNTRLWYPQLDVFDTTRRFGLLLPLFPISPGLERLYIADFFLANPPLLHKTTMSQSMRQAFRALSIPRPEKTFLQYPSAQVLFQRMEQVQRSAFTALSGKSLVALHKGRVQLSESGAFLFSSLALYTQEEEEIASFLATDFASEEAPGNQTLRLRTGLRRAS